MPYVLQLMGKVFDEILAAHVNFINEQHLFFVATAPLSADGHVNVSPKGLHALKILSANEVVYLDMVGSGNETSAHILENKRITFMFCSFDSTPNILRLYGHGQTILSNHEKYKTYAALFNLPLGTRQFIYAKISRVQTSCGFGVPLFTFISDRNTLNEWAIKKGNQLRQYVHDKNLESIDGLPTALSNTHGK
jgi:hypothetical protein